MATAYQHTYTDTGGRVLGVMIHGAIRNITVSVKMGVRGISWVWERRGRDQKALSECFSLTKQVKLITTVHLLSTYSVLDPAAFLYAPINFCFTPGDRYIIIPVLQIGKLSHGALSHRTLT